MPVGVEPLPPLEYVVGLGRLVDGLVPRLLEEVVAGGRLTVIFPAGLLTFECLRDGAGLWDDAGLFTFECLRDGAGLWDGAGFPW